MSVPNQVLVNAMNIQEDFIDQFQDLVMEMNDKAYWASKSASTTELGKAKNKVHEIHQHNQTLGTFLDDIEPIFLGKRELVEQKNKILASYSTTTMELKDSLGTLRRLHKFAENKEKLLQYGVNRLDSLSQQCFDLTTRERVKLENLKQHLVLVDKQANSEGPSVSEDFKYTFRLVDKVIAPYFSSRKLSAHICMLCWTIFGERAGNSSVPVRASDSVPLAFNLKDALGSSQLSDTDRQIRLESVCNLFRLLNNMGPQPDFKLPLVLIQDQSCKDHACFQNPSTVKFLDVHLLLQQLDTLEVNRCISLINNPQSHTKISQSRSGTHPTSSAPVCVAAPGGGAPVSGNQALPGNQAPLGNQNPPAPNIQSSGVPPLIDEALKVKTFREGISRCLVSAQALDFGNLVQSMSVPPNSEVLKVSYQNEAAVFLSTTGITQLEWFAQLKEEESQLVAAPTGTSSPSPLAQLAVSNGIPALPVTTTSGQVDCFGYMLPLFEQ